MKTLLLDIETAPNKAYVWGLWDQNIAINQIEESGYVLCWSAKWLGQDEVRYASCQRQTRQAMLKPVHAMLDEADAVVHYNGQKFDIPVLQKEFLKHDLLPAAPYKQIDLMLVVKRAFRFESNKLDYVVGALGLGTKVRHPGFEMWVKCMEGNREAWRQMEAYNRGDVALLEKLYKRLLPWIDRHPNQSVYAGGKEICTRCGSHNIQKRGTAIASTRRYYRFQCQSCGGWFRSTKSLSGAQTANIGS